MKGAKIDSVNLTQYYVVKPTEPPFIVNRLVDVDNTATEALSDMYNAILEDPLQEVVKKGNGYSLRPFLD